MARLPRLCVPGYPHHVIHRGNDRQVVFREPADFEMFLSLMQQYAQTEKVAVHSYVLMSNHLHLLATPEEASGLPRMMQALGRRYAQYFNRRHARTGTLWEGRYRATVIQTERYLLACMVYIDLNPVRAGMVLRPADHPWSSYRHYAGIAPDRRITPHALIWGLGNTPFEREARYVDLVNQGIAVREQASLTDSALNNWALGDDDFVHEVQARVSRRLRRSQAGRPPMRKPS
ncbi:MAG: transposase [Panacagrimonas sp.]